MRVGVLGGTRGIGRALVSQLIESGHEVTVLARNPMRLDMASDSLTVRQGDARDRVAVANLVTNQDAVCSCLGINPTRAPVNLFSESAALSTAIESCTGLGVNPRGWTVGVGWIDRLRVSGCIHTLEFLRRPVAEGGVQASSIVYLLKEVGESVG